MGVAKRRDALRASTNATLQQRIVAIHAASRATYGAPRIHAELQAQGVRCSRKRVARLMRLAGVAGVTAGASERPDGIPRVRALLIWCSGRSRRAPNQVWVADSHLTYVPTRQGFLASSRLFAASHLDAYSRRVVGWSMANHLRAELVVAALEMALQHRRPAAGVIHHSDHGSQYTAQTFQERCRAAGIRSSMGSVGDSSENKQLTGTVARALILKTYGHEACDGDAPCLGGGLRQVHLVA